MTHALRPRAGLVALAFLALHLPFLPASLEDLDSINFALGIRDFDVAQHQPHPPGYPVFMLAAKAVHAFVPSEAHALSLIGVLAGGLAVFALMAFFDSLEDRQPGARPAALLAALLSVTAPLFWVTATRPLSDMAGLAVALAVQAVAVTARTRTALVGASFAAGLGAGIRSQVVWLTAPVLLFAVARQPRADRWRTAAGMAAGYVAGGLVWAIPLVLLAGGPSAYLHALFSQGSEDFSGVVMLWTTPTARQLARTLQYTFISPWGSIPGAVVVLCCALLGLAALAIRDRRTLVTLAVAFGPYLTFHMLFQETATTRYALPLVVPVAFAAVRGLSVIPAHVTTVAVPAFAVFNAFLGIQAMYWYSKVEAPAFHMLDDMRTSARPPAPVLAMHRRDALDLRRPILWTGLPDLDARIPSPPKHEWLEVVKYWNGGGRRPVWFVADPPRSDLALFRRQRPPVRYRWPFDIPLVMGGVRPNEMDWYEIEPPDWYLGEGWAITPETAGVAREDGRGPGRGGIQGWIRRWPGSATLLVGGRNLGSAGPARVSVGLDGRPVDETAVAPGFFLRMITLPAGRLEGSGDYATVTITADSDQIAIEQFDLQPEGRLVFGYGDGWNELEYNPATGRLWRWSTERATVRLRSGGRALTLRLDGEIEAGDSSHVAIRAGDRLVADQQVGRVFSISATIAAGLLGEAESSLTLETSAWYVPAKERWRSRDQRHLGLKIYSFQLVPAS